MAAATASEPTTQLARLGLSEQEFKEKTELMRLYLQDNSGATSFDDFCRRRPDRNAERTNDQARPAPVEKKPPPEPAKSASNTHQKAFNAIPMFPPVGLPMPGAPLNPQMFGMMPAPHLQRHVLPMSIPGAMPMPGMIPGHPLSYYPPMWFNPAALMPGQPMATMANPWLMNPAALAAQQPILNAPNVVSKPSTTPTNDTSKSTKESSKQSKDTKELKPAPNIESEPRIPVQQTPQTPKTPKRRQVEPSPFTPAAAIFISPPGSEIAGTPMTAILRPDFFPAPIFHSPSIELLRPKPPPTSDEVDPATIFKLPDPPYATTKPPYSYAALIGQALNAAHRNRACLDHIYLYISTVYPYYKRGEQAWQNSIRHNLSQNSSFTRLKHPSGGQHGEWAIREEDKHCFANGGYIRSQRPPEAGRKRRRKGAFDDDTDLEEDISPRKKSKKAPSKNVNREDDTHVSNDQDRSPSPTHDHPSTDNKSSAASLQLPSRRDVMARAKADSQVASEKKARSNYSNSGRKGFGQRQGQTQSRSKGKKRKVRQESEEALSDDYESELNDTLSPLFGKGKPLGLDMILRFKHEDEEVLSDPLDLADMTDIAEVTDVPDALVSPVSSIKDGSTSPPLGSILSEAFSEGQSEIQSEPEEMANANNDMAQEATGRNKPSEHPQDLMERTLMEKAKEREKAVAAKRSNRYPSVPAATLANLSPMRRLNTTPLKSAIRGTSHSHRLDDVMNRQPVNSEPQDEDSMSGEESTHGRNRDEQEDEREKSVTPPPLVPNPPWMAAPLSPLSVLGGIASTPQKASRSKLSATDGDDDEDIDNDGLLSKPIPLKRHTSLCISPNSSQYHHRTTFLTPARATGSNDRPYDISFPPIPPSSLSLSPFRNTPVNTDPVTPDRSSSTTKPVSMFLQTPIFSSSFSDVRLEDELARMSGNGDSESPGGIFRSSDLYRSPSLPGTSPSRWARH